MTTIKYPVSVLLGLLTLASLNLNSVAKSTEPPITDLAFTPDGNSVIAVSQTGITEYQWPDLTKVRTVKTEAVNLHALAFAPAGDRVAVGGGTPSVDGIVEVYSWPKLEKQIALRDQFDSVMAIAWQGDDQLFAASLDRSVVRYDVRAGRSLGRSLGRFEGHSRGVSDLVILRDQVPSNESVVTVGHDQSLRFWELESDKLVRSMNLHTRPIHALAVRPGDGNLPMVASAAADRTVRFWQPTIGRMVRYARLGAQPLDLAWTNDGAHALACGTDGQVHVIDPDDVANIRTVPAIDGWAYTIAIHPNGNAAVAGQDGQIHRLTKTEYLAAK